MVTLRRDDTPSGCYAKGKAMKHTVRIIGFLVFGVLATSCNKPTDEDSKAQSDQPGTAAMQREKAITATKEAAQSVRVYAYAERDEFIDAANRELSDIQADAEARLEVVSDRWAAAKVQLDRAEAATEDSWEDVQSRYRAARSDLKRSFDDARQWLSERIEP